MADYPIYKEIVPIDVLLECIYLDPNNPRFVDADWTYIPEKRISEKAIQDKIQVTLETKYSVDKLVMSIETNGFLSIDRVVVKQFDENKFVVLEGNRRICAAKMLLQRHAEDETAVPSEIIESIKSIACLQYIGSNGEASWIFQGLRHITGIMEWSGFNKAKLLVELMEEESLTLSAVGKRFGLTPHGAGQWVRGYFAFKQAKEQSDFISEIDQRSYPYFQEIFSRSNSAIREWLGWDEQEKQFKDDLNFNEFIAWLYPREENCEDGTDTKGDWEKRRLVRSDNLRTLSYLLKQNKTEFDNFRVTGNLEQAYLNALQKANKENADPVEDVFDVIKSCTKALEDMPFKILRDATSKTRLFQALTSLEQAIIAVKE